MRGLAIANARGCSPACFVQQQGQFLAVGGDVSMNLGKMVLDHLAFDELVPIARGFQVDPPSGGAERIIADTGECV